MCWDRVIDGEASEQAKTPRARPAAKRPNVHPEPAETAPPQAPVPLTQDLPELVETR